MAPTLVQAAVLLLFGGLASGSSNDLFIRQSLIIANSSTLPTNWTSLGCYLDPGNPRTLQSASYVNTTSMTEESCVTYCKGLKYIYAGVEYSQECYCGNTFSTNVSEPSTDCSMACTGNSSEACGGPNRLNIFWSGSPPPPPPETDPGPPGWGFIGCYAEGTTGRTLTTGVNVPGGASNMTVALCTSACGAAGFTLAGVEYAEQCFCGDSFQNGGAPATGGISDCNMLCTGNSSEYCGAGNFLDVYQFGSINNKTTTTTTTTTTSSSSSADPPGTTTGTSASSTPSSTGPVHVPSVGAFTWQGCYTEATNERALSAATYVNYTSMTVEICAAFCASYTMFGVEYAGECYCGDTLNAGSVLAATSSCDMTCDGNPNEYCGGPDRLDYYTGPGAVTPTTTSGGTTATTASTGTVASGTGPVHVASVGAYTWQGCYTEATDGRALSAASLINYDTMTVEICAAFCASYTMFGVEYAGECYCGDTLNAGSVLAATSSCDMTCDGNPNEYCGGPDRLDYYTGKATTTTGGGGGGATSTAPVSTPSATGNDGATLPAGWKYDGCWVDNVDGRIMRYEQPDNDELTVESCISACIGLDYTVAGIEYGVQCFCDSMIVNGGALAANQGDCNMACPGNANEMCGSGNRMDVFNTGTLTAIGVPVEQTGNISGWTYKGCRTDNVGNPQVRTLPWQIILPLNNSATNCLLQCSTFGYNAGGMEYGEECYCGDISYVEAGGSTLVADSECATACSGNASEICGDGNLLSYYEWTGPPLYTWATPTGVDAGEYQFLIGGLCVPLISTPAVNGKVTFLEKFGTSENASSTGAYELDLYFLEEFDMAWRTMHVQSDVFCSASLTLPDKVGRQINIGGWAEESVFGIRLYWPNGSPGVPSTNDWQEDYNELHLQVARWYPSALTLANGSILVVGGEVGSNSAPSPTLEILPPTGGGLVYCDWLNRTDPLNLYPFLAILPSGYIFVAYYNEARLLDPGTFDTYKTLPNMPGNVNNFEAGRTYPLEGTMVLLPQYAPYGDDLTVLICGGSTTGAGEASDNCVSTQPDSANPTWTIERMPSVRVMTCICALPDGTFLILNGAKQGVAGFGLATDPNLVAVLYNPSLPLGGRMSIMSSTIVARLYHSEATLLLDGRVIVSGSDPEDGVNPEEYRVEVFVPPYLLKGATPPTLNVSNVDWTYGEEITVSVVIPTGVKSNVVFSLIGAMSSTHGNSMGQRTLFPAFSCSSITSCTITVPPNVNICPLGWYRLFVLDAGTPGFATWVRIGGDPGELGNWPAGLPDFTVPGLGPVGSTWQS